MAPSIHIGSSWKAQAVPRIPYQYYGETLDEFIKRTTQADRERIRYKKAK